MSKAVAQLHDPLQMVSTMCVVNNITSLVPFRSAQLNKAVATGKIHAIQIFCAEYRATVRQHLCGCAPACPRAKPRQISEPVPLTKWGGVSWLRYGCCFGSHGVSRAGNGLYLTASLGRAGGVWDSRCWRMLSLNAFLVWWNV